MPLVLTTFSRQLQFRFDARTSRGAMQTHQVHYLRLHHTSNPEVQGWGECSPLPGLSPDYSPVFSETLHSVCDRFNALKLEEVDDFQKTNLEQELINWPSILFAFETGLLDLNRGGKRVLFENAFSRSEGGIKINGLIWMGDESFMREMIKKKLAQGFSCLKLKIGGLDFEQELRILEQIREVAGADVLELRLDANGAFLPVEAQKKLKELSAFHIHSIEQPIKPGQIAQMQALCEKSAIPIALDEELIGVYGKENKENLLHRIRPAYIILKPTLVGGMQASREWIEVAEPLNIAWWLTSALESNIGLNAIAQFSQEFENRLPQGLGTGQLYHNNLASPLKIKGEELWYEPDLEWELPEE